MNSIVNLQKILIIAGVPLFIIGLMIALANSPIFNANSSILSIGITFDLLLTLPLVYFLGIRKTRIPKTTLVPFLIIGMVVCSLILPLENQYYLNLFKTWMLPVVELSVLYFVIYRIRKAIKRYRLNKTESFDFFTTLKSTCYEILPKAVVYPVVMEMAVFYYGFMNWKKRKLKDDEFTYHKDSGTIPLLAVIILLIAMETVVFHILLVKWSSIAAWILTFLSVYSGIQLFGFLKSMYKRPISIEDGRLFLRYGIMNETSIELANIDSIEITSKDIELNEETRKLSFLGDLESHNIQIRLKEENTLSGLYGIKRNYSNLVLYIDNKIEFEDRINKALQN